MNFEYINIGIAALRGISCLLLLIFLYQMQKSYLLQSLEDKAGNLYRKTKEKTIQGMKAGNGLSRYQALNHKIHGSGLYYKSGGRITPFEYQMIKYFLCLGFLILGMKIHMAAALPAGIFGYFVIDILMRKSNQLENEEMLHDIETIYNSLELHTSSGVYVLNALYECQRLVKMPRLARALDELVMEILGTQDVDKAIENFKDKFSNQYIDSLAIALKQSLNGETTRIFEDMSRQIDSINEAMLLKEENRKASVILLVNSLIFVGIMAATMYVSFMGLGAAFTDVF